MKYLIVLAVIAVVYALWRSQRQVPPNRERTAPEPCAAPGHGVLRALWRAPAQW